MAQTAVAPRKDQRTATTSTADIQRRSRPGAVGFVTPLSCFAILGEAALPVVGNEGRTLKTIKVCVDK